MKDMLQDPMFFYSIAFVIFLALAYRYTRKPLLGWLDAEIAKIRDEVERSKQLRAEAETELAEYKARHAAALAEAEAIVDYAQKEAQRLKAQSEADLKDMVARHEQQAIERLQIAEAEAVAEVRAATIDLAMEMARKMLALQLDEAGAAKLADQAIADMQKLAGNKAKAA